MDPSELIAHMGDLFDNAHDGPARTAALAWLDSEWDDIAIRPPMPGDAEACRLAMMMAAQNSDPRRAAVWRARALSRFVQVGWHEGVGSILLSEAFVALAHANRDYPRGHFLDTLQPCPESQAIIAELRPFTVLPGSGISTGPRSPSPGLLSRFLYENEGLLLLIAGDYSGARDAYRQAVAAAAGSERGQIKSLLGLALVDYVQAVRTGEASPSPAATEELVDRARVLGAMDLVTAGEHNVAEMRRGGLHLLPYAIL